MKKVLWLIVCLMTMVVSANAQVADTQETYCMIVGTQKFFSSKCTFTVDVRSNEMYSNEELFNEIRQHIGSDIQARSFRLNSSRIALSHPLVQKIISLGGQPFGSPTLSDQALMPFPSFKLGPGDSNRSHSADEYIKISEIEQAIDTYVALLDGLTL